MLNGLTVIRNGKFLARKHQTNVVYECGQGWTDDVQNAKILRHPDDMKNASRIAGAQMAIIVGGKITKVLPIG